MVNGAARTVNKEVNNVDCHHLVLPYHFVALPQMKRIYIMVIVILKNQGLNDLQHKLWFCKTTNEETCYKLPFKKGMYHFYETSQELWIL